MLYGVNRMASQHEDGLFMRIFNYKFDQNIPTIKKVMKISRLSG